MQISILNKKLFHGWLWNANFTRTERWLSIWVAKLVGEMAAVAAVAARVEP